jgi:hypothetical protein
MDIIKNPCEKSLKCQSACMGLSAPEMTAVSNPNKNPAIATTKDQ